MFYSYFFTKKLYVISNRFFIKELKIGLKYRYRYDKIDNRKVQFMYDFKFNLRFLNEEVKDITT